MKIIVVGSGMYVTGRNDTGIGTVISSLAELSKNNIIDEVLVTARNELNKKDVDIATKRVNNLLKSNLKVNYFALGSDDSLNKFNSICDEFSPNAAIVATPDHTHFDYAKNLLQKDVHCLVVKPLTPTLEKSAELTSIQQKSECLGYVEFHKRYDVSNLRVKRALRENKIGNILYFTVDYSQKSISL
jgi:predicted dehydrogenase